MRNRRIWTTVALILSVPAAALAGGTTFGSEFAINTYTSDFQGDPRVAASEAGFVVTWWGYGADQSLSARAQIYNSSGSKVGGEFRVNTVTGTTDVPSVAMDKSGNFVVVWSGTNGTTPGIEARRFTSTGSPIGSEFQANADTTSGKSSAAVAMGPAGNFVVVWAAYDQDGSKSGVFGQRFDSAGAKAGGEFLVNTVTTGTQKLPAIGIADSGSFVVTWTAGSVGENPDGDGYGIFGQRFDASGAKLGSEFLVNTTTTSFQRIQSMAMDRRGNFVVVWEGSLQEAPGDESGIYGQRFDPSGTKLGPEFHVNTYTTGSQVGPSVAMDSAGNVLVVWASEFGDGSSYGSFGQQFDRSGHPVGSEFPINIFTTGHQWAAQAAGSSSGFTVVWESENEDGSDYGIFGRRQDFRPIALKVDATSTTQTSSDLDGILEPGEGVFVQPLWVNQSALFADLSGSSPLTFCFLGSPCVAPGDRFADYGTLPPGSLGTCNDGSDDACYTVGASGPRPGVHWDGELVENLSVGGTWVYTLHVGDSFTDVPRSQPFYAKIETVLHKGITAGCGGTKYCPGDPVPRDQMSIFIAKAMAGSGESVPVSGNLSGIPFGSTYNCTAGGTSLLIDVAPTDSFCKHAHYLTGQNVALGCGNFQYCPGAIVTRDAMASFIAKALVAPAGGGAIPNSYTDPTTHLSYSCAPATPNLHFKDVPVTSAFCKHIHYLWAKGIVSGCSATQFCPGAPVARDAMAKFIANAFALKLYEP